ncbi:MAG: hypothetical protein ACXQTS_04960, partial [Candidatus Methanospirareceae archaeon]
LFMDLFTYYSPIFWPFYNKSIYIITQIITKTANFSKLHLLFEIKLEPIDFYHTTSMDAPIFTSQGVAVTIILLIGLILKEKIKRRL